jgi:hypothetical protein
MIATLDDVIERLANEIGVYGAHTELHPDGKCECRVCWTIDTRSRILFAVELEIKLGSISFTSPAKRQVPVFTDEQKIAVANAIFDIRSQPLGHGPRSLRRGVPAHPV